MGIMSLSSDCYENDDHTMTSWVFEKDGLDPAEPRFVVKIAERKTEGQPVHFDGEVIWHNDVAYVLIETHPFRSGVPAFQYALETVGKDPDSAEIEYDKFLTLPRSIKPLSPDYRPRREEQKEK